MIRAIVSLAAFPGYSCCKGKANKTVISICFQIILVAQVTAAAEVPAMKTLLAVSIADKGAMLMAVITRASKGHPSRYGAYP